ncbi:MAG TPA: helix-turn-helix transcriptional regulator [Gemmatimonadaceae bacterium]|jgi:transcriptional regulator with XRE-family HTH domain|nr:helix-turn-helix transcriptional regulator [Gemmatimonadaceae bacterium]
MHLSKDRSDSTILEELGRRLTQARLDRNLTQEELATAAGVSKRTVERLETGSSVQLANFIRTLRALDLVQSVEHLIPLVAPSPIAQLKLQGKERQRASSPKGSQPASDRWRWGDDP